MKKRKSKIGSQVRPKGSGKVMRFSDLKYFMMITGLYLGIVISLFITNGFNDSSSMVIYYVITLIFGLFSLVYVLIFMKGKMDERSPDYVPLDRRTGPTFVECIFCGTPNRMLNEKVKSECTKCGRWIDLQDEAYENEPLTKIQCPKCKMIIFTRKGSGEVLKCHNCDVELIVG